MSTPVHWTPVRFSGHYDSARPSALEGYTAATGLAGRSVTLRRVYSPDSWKRKGTLLGWKVFVDDSEQLVTHKTLKLAKEAGGQVVEQIKQEGQKVSNDDGWSREEMGDPTTDTVVENPIPRALTSNQRSVLRKMVGRSGIRRHGVAYDGAWEVGCGWAWVNNSTTIAIMEGLYKRGMVSRSALADLNGRYRYTVTDLGRKAAEAN